MDFSVESIYVQQAVQNRPSAFLHSPCVIAAYGKYASFPMTSQALHSDIFEQPVNAWF